MFFSSGISYHLQHDSSDFLWAARSPSSSFYEVMDQPVCKTRVGSKKEILHHSYEDDEAENRRGNEDHSAENHQDPGYQQ